MGGIEIGAIGRHERGTMIVVYSAARDSTGRACIVKQVDPKPEDLIPMPEQEFGVFQRDDGFCTACHYERFQTFRGYTLVRKCKTMTGARRLANRMNGAR